MKLGFGNSSKLKVIETTDIQARTTADMRPDFKKAEELGAEFLVAGNYQVKERELIAHGVLYDVKSEMVKTSVLYTGKVGFSIFDSIDQLAVDEETLLKQLPNYLYSLISAGQAIVMIQEKKRAHSRFAFSVKRQGETVDILIGLYKKDSLLEETVYSYTAGELEYEDFSRFAAAAAERAIPHLTMVKPEVKITSLVREKELERKIEEIDFSEQLNKRYELTARVGHLVKFLHIGSEEGDSVWVDTVYTPLLPLRIELARFKKRNNGLLFHY